MRRTFLDDGEGVVGGIVEHLDLEAVARVIETGAGVDHFAGHIALVEHRKLHGDIGQLVALHHRKNGVQSFVFVVLEIQIEKMELADRVESDQQGSESVERNDGDGGEVAGEKRLQDVEVA
jgi:hypothetical protein